jgi:hypothetical protein
MINCADLDHNRAEKSSSEKQERLIKLNFLQPDQPL